MSGLVLSLCDYTGAWSQPYEDAGYEVVRIDLKRGQDVRLMQLPGIHRSGRHRLAFSPVRGVLAAPP